MEFFYVVKATQKSGKEDAVIWFTAKSEARANLQLDVELEDAGIETGRGKDYVKPVRTDFPVFNDLPEESTVDYTWCKRYELQDDGRTWLPKAGAESTGPVDNSAAPETTVKVETIVESVPLENRTPAVRFAVHLISDKYQSNITKEQQLAASEMSLDEGNTYLQNLLLAKNDIPEVAELSLNAEWKLVQAIKQVFAPDEEHEVKLLTAFMADWLRVDAGDRNEVVREWRNGKLTLLKSERTSDADFTTDQVPEPENGIQIDENDDETTRYPVVRMPFRKQLLAQFTADELRHHLTREEYEGISALEMDTDNSYVQNLLLAAENCEEVKGYDTKDLWRYTDAIRKVFSQEKRHELALVLRFTRIWAATDYIDRGTLVREWVEGNRISEVGSPAPLEPEKPETTESYKRAVAQNMANLSIEIAIAQLYPDAVPGQINRTQLLAAKELADKKDESHAKALKVLSKTTDILDYDANSIFGVTRAISWSGEESTTKLRSQVREWFTANGIYESGERSKGYPEWNEDSREVRHSTVEEPSTPSQTKVASLGSGVFSIDGLMDGNTEPVINTNSNEVEKTENTAETTSDVQMEEAGNDEITNGAPLSEGEEEVIAGESSTETDSKATALNTNPSHHNDDVADMLFTHLMVDVESLGEKPDAPIVSIGAVFFNPASGQTGPEFYKVISLESSMEWGGVPDASTILFWLRATPEARSEIVMDHAIPLDDALLQFKDFIAENAANGKDTVQVWGNGATFDNVLLENSYARTGITCPWKFWNNRDVRTVVELGKAVGCEPRYEIPFDGEPHKAISDALHQVKYVSAIWQRLTEH